MRNPGQSTTGLSAPAARSLGTQIDEATFAPIKPTPGRFALANCLEGHRLDVATSYFWLDAEFTSWNVRSLVENGGKADMGGRPISVAIDPRRT